MLSKITGYIENLQNNDPTEPELFRIIVKKQPQDYKELAYVNRYRTAFNLELAVVLNIPIAMYLFARCRPKFNPSIKSQKRHRLLASAVLVSQLNVFGIALYLRKVKRYEFEDELAMRHYKELQGLKSNREKSK